jgi:hypothetical protein
LQALFYNTWIIELNCGFTADRSLLSTLALSHSLNDRLCYLAQNERDRRQKKGLWSTIEHQPMQKLLVFNSYVLGLKLECKQLINVMVE